MHYELPCQPISILLGLQPRHEYRVDSLYQETHLSHLKRSRSDSSQCVLTTAPVADSTPMIITAR